MAKNTIKEDVEFKSLLAEAAAARTLGGKRPGQKAAKSSNWSKEGGKTKEKDETPLKTSGYNKAGPFFPGEEEAEAKAFGLTIKNKINTDVAPRIIKKVDEETQIDLGQLEASPMRGYLTTDGANWYDIAPIVVVPKESNDEEAAAGGKRGRNNRQVVKVASAETMLKLKFVAEKLFTKEIAAYEARKNKMADADEKWMRSVLTTGTSADKLAAMTLLVQRSPVHALRQLDNLLFHAKKKSRREASTAIEALQDLFITNLLPSNRKLSFWMQHAPEVAALAAGTALSELESDLDGKKSSEVTIVTSLTADLLVWWYFEDALKSRYIEYINSLRGHLQDGMENFKLSSLNTVYKLLVERPEGEEELLNLMVHKMSDREKKVASKAQYLLLQLVSPSVHPAMKTVLVREVRQLLYSPSSTEHARYYGSLLLNQLTLSRKNPELAAELLETYFVLFEAAVKAGNVNSRLLSALLTGVNRALPYASTPEVLTAVEAKSDSVFTILHIGSPSTSVQAMILLQNMAERRLEVGKSNDEYDPFVDRVYRALYSRLTPQHCASTNKHAILLNSVYKAMKIDPCVPRVKAFVKRIVSTACHMPANFAAGVVFLVAEILSYRDDLHGMIVTPENVAANEHSTKNRDVDGADAEAPEIKDALVELDHVLEGGVDLNDETGSSSDEDSSSSDDDSSLDSGSEADHEDEVNENVYDSMQNKGPNIVSFDAYKREPKYAGADFSCLWELAPLAAHTHPTVRTFAEAVLNNPGEPIVYKGDPLADLSMMAFLDRYVYKNPKKKAVIAFGGSKIASDVDQYIARGYSQEAAEELAAGFAMLQGKDVEADKAVEDGKIHGISSMQRRMGRHGRVDVEAPANTLAFATLDEKNVRAEDMFMHQYFRNKKQLDGKDKAISIGDELEDNTFFDSDVEDPEYEAFAQKLAEDLMEKGNVSDDISDFEMSGEDEGVSDVGSDASGVDANEDDDFALMEEDLEEYDPGMDIHEDEGDGDERGASDKNAKKIKTSSGPFASAEDYAHLLDSDNEENWMGTSFDDGNDGDMDGNNTLPTEEEEDDVLLENILADSDDDEPAAKKLKVAKSSKNDAPAKTSRESKKDTKPGANRKVGNPKSNTKSKKFESKSKPKSRK